MRPLCVGTGVDFENSDVRSGAECNALKLQKSNARTIAEIRERETACKAALANVALPFLREVEISWTKSPFVVLSPVIEDDDAPVCVSFVAGTGFEYGIETTSGNVRAWKRTIDDFSQNRTRVVGPKHYFMADEEPRIGCVADITHQKIARLIRLAIHER
jgi:hypothetical protein